MSLNNLGEFKPAWWAPGGHLQTVAGYYFPAPAQLTPTHFHTVTLADGEALRLCENRPFENTLTRGIILLMHGLGGSAQSPYMRRAAALFQEHGWIVFRLNHRGCGEGRGLARKLYHSGKSDDVSAALQHVAKSYPALPIAAVGFSLSGNALLKVLGEKTHPIPANLRGAIAICPPINLSLCAIALARKSNWLYEQRFVHMVKTSLRERAEDFPDFPRPSFPGNLTLRQFDDMYTAPLNGFASAEDYYQKCSARQFLANISHPTFLLASDDDPFIPVETFRDLPRHQFLQAQITRSGGHMGFVAAEKTPWGNRQWLEYTMVNWVEKFVTMSS